MLTIFFRSMQSRILIVTATLIALSACSSMPSQTSESYTIPIPLPERPLTYSPIESQEGRSTRTIIRIRKPIGSETGIKKEILMRLQQTLDRELGKLSIPVIDRQFDHMVQDEVELAEQYGKEGGRHDADTVLLLVLDSYSSETSASDKSRFYNKDKKYADCDYRSQLSGWIRAYEIPSMRIIDQWNIKESEKDSFEESHSRICKQKFEVKLKELNHSHIDATVCKIKEKIGEVLVPTGYILAAEQREESTLLEISLGSNMGLKPGDNLHLYHEITGTPYGKAKVTDEISATLSYVEITSLNKGESIYQSDIVRPYGNSIFNTIKNLSCHL